MNSTPTPIPYRAPRPCAVCGRAGGPISFTAINVRHDFCSMQCSEIFMVARAGRIELTHSEEDAAIAGGKAGGAFLDHLGKTDLAEMNKEEWTEFCRQFLAAAFADLQRQADETIPY